MLIGIIYTLLYTSTFKNGNHHKIICHQTSRSCEATRDEYMEFTKMEFTFLAPRKDDKRMNQRKVYVCSKIKLNAYLNKHGYFAFMTRKDHYNPSRLVWIYEDSKPLKECIKEYYRAYYND